jgi:hypothetical protein
MDPYHSHGLANRGYQNRSHWIPQGLDHLCVNLVFVVRSPIGVLYLTGGILDPQPLGGLWIGQGNLADVGPSGISG